MANNKNTKNKQKLFTINDVEPADGFPLFKSDKERITKMTKAFKDMEISEAFEYFYGMKTTSKSTNNANNFITNLELGKIYLGTVNEFKKNTLTFDVPGIKNEIIAQDNFNTCADIVENYLLTHDNKLLFEVREKRNNKYYVSVIGAYYQAWVNNVKKCIAKNIPINVHIDSLVKGGYLCHLPIDTIVELTGKPYTHLAFVPGSQIVLNIEHDFEKWIGQDISIIPQNFVDYYKNFKTGEVEKSLVGSRKKLLSMHGMNNMYTLYNTYKLMQNVNADERKDIALEGIVTGVINSRDVTGVFVEIEDQYITGLLPIDPVDLLDYRVGNKVNVKIDTFEVQPNKEPFVLNKQNKVLYCNTRVIFKQ